MRPALGALQGLLGMRKTRIQKLHSRFSFRSLRRPDRAAAPNNVKGAHDVRAHVTLPYAMHFRTEDTVNDHRDNLKVVRSESAMEDRLEIRSVLRCWLSSEEDGRSLPRHDALSNSTFSHGILCRFPAERSWRPFLCAAERVDAYWSLWADVYHDTPDIYCPMNGPCALHATFAG